MNGYYTLHMSVNKARIGLFDGTTNLFSELIELSKRIAYCIKTECLLSSTCFMDYFHSSTHIALADPTNRCCRLESAISQRITKSIQSKMYIYYVQQENVRTAKSCIV